MARAAGKGLFEFSHFSGISASKDDLAMPEVQSKYCASQSSFLFLCAINFLLGWLEGKNLLLVPWPEDSASIRWGVFAGEALFAITWISLGPQPFSRRAIASLNWGLCLCIMTWLGYLIGYGSKAWIYKVEFGYVVTQMPVAVLLASAPLFLFRIRNFLVISRDHPLRPERISDMALLLLTFPLLAIPLSVRRLSALPIAEDLYWAFVFGSIAAMMVFPIVPLLVIAFFRKKLPFYSVLLPFITLLAVDQVAVANFPIPAGGGSYIAYRAGGILAFVTAAVVACLCFEKRLQGYRLKGLDKQGRSK
jgi:hypothetical protein